MALPWGQRVLVLLAGVVCCLLLFGTASAVADSSVAAASEAGVPDIEADSFDADRTIFIITVRDDGSAEWRFRYEQRLETDNETSDFEAYADRFNTEETESFRNFRTRASALTASGSNVTDRSMTAESFDREARIEERAPAGDAFAIVEMSFVWTGFAETTEGQVIVGDVFVDGLYVGIGQELRFERGAGLQFESVEPDPDSIASETLADSESITWTGEMQFTDRRPRMVLTEREDEPESPGSDTVNSDPGMPPAEDPGAFLPFFAFIVVILLGIVGAFAYRRGVFRSDGNRNWRTIGGLRTGEGDDSDAADGTETADSEPALGSSATGSIGASSTATDSSIDAASVGDEPVLSDEELVLELLRSREGRMRQTKIVEETDWSKSKVSMRLSEMEDDGTISRLRVGRENIVSLAGHEPDAVGSPFDDDDA